MSHFLTAVIFHLRLYGSYEALIRGHTIDALVDLTGGVAVKYELRKPHSNLSVQMRK